MKFTPGPGLGGHCIPLDPHYLSWKMRTLSFKTKMIEVASEINASMPLYTVEKIGRDLNFHQKAFKNSKILILGIAYKKNIDDLRESPALDIISLLEERESEIYYYDKMCPIINNDGHTKIKKLPMFSIDTLNKEVIQNMDCVVVITDHDGVDYNEVNDVSKIFIDMRGVLKKDSSLNDKI
jgi:UDP-N-acetyl-D-glucosamine dehydrogenase